MGTWASPWASRRAAAGLATVGVRTALVAVAACGRLSPTNTGASGDFNAVGGAGGASTTSGSSGNPYGGEGGSGDGGAGASAGAGGEGGLQVPWCASGCGPTELCDGVNKGADDDCDGEVDEGCPCLPGEATACFQGDSTLANAPGCASGIQRCEPWGEWGPCEGGAHASAGCHLPPSPQPCQPLFARPFVPVDLGAALPPGVQAVFDVACPEADVACPVPLPMGSATWFQALRAGEHQVTAQWTSPDGTASVCTFPLFARERGLRVELTWEHDASDADLDLYVHEPASSAAWGDLYAGADCYYANCRAAQLVLSGAGTPDWFAGQPPEWSKAASSFDDSCYHLPGTEGETWSAAQKGCHNPRLELVRDTCDPTLTDPNALPVPPCFAESVAVDHPPALAWTRLAVRQFDSPPGSPEAHPRLRIFCDGHLAADLGSHASAASGEVEPLGFGAPVAFGPAAGRGSVANPFWIAADVAFYPDSCGVSPCAVAPLFADPVSRTPIVVPFADAQVSVGPPYPPAP